MLTISVQIESAMDRIEQAADKAAGRIFPRVAASIRKDAMGSIKKGPPKSKAKRRKGKVVRRATHEPSPPGTPPHTQRGQAKRAITFHADSKGAVIGPRKSVVGFSMSAHEFGGTYKGQTYPARPTLGPALERQVSRFAREWAGSITT